MDLMITIFCISLIIVLSGSIYKKLQDIFLTEPLIAMLVGILLGPFALNVFHKLSMEEEHSILELACKLTIAMALMSTALRIPKDFYRKYAASQGIIVVAGMLLMWISSGALLYMVLPALDFFQCLLIGAIITPTDPVIASSIITGKKAEKLLPKSIRHTLSFEAGANDGLAFPIVTFAFFLLQPEEHTLSDWILKKVLYETVLASILAYAAGSGAGLVMHRAHKAGIMSQKTILSFSLALSLLLLSGLEYLKMNGIIGVFVGGIGFARHMEMNEDLQEEKVQESMERIFTIPIFFLFGVFLPWEGIEKLGWTALIIPLLILLFRRLPVFLLMVPFLPKFKGKIPDALILGWYGPIGVAALFYVIFAMKKVQMEEAWIITCLIIFSSTVVHGLSSIPFAKIYDKFKSGYS